MPRRLLNMRPSGLITVWCWPSSTSTSRKKAVTGATTAAEGMATLSAGAKNLTDGVSIGTGGFKDQMGFNSANLLLRQAERVRAGNQPGQAIPLIELAKETLREILRHDPQLRQLGFDQRFMHIWEFYLAYCEAAFAMGNTSVMQFTLQRA